jgi:hypothetical protein
LDPTVLPVACKPAAQARNRCEAIKTRPETRDRAASASGTEKITDSLE